MRDDRCLCVGHHEARENAIASFFACFETFYGTSATIEHSEFAVFTG